VTGASSFLLSVATGVTITTERSSIGWQGRAEKNGGQLNSKDTRAIYADGTGYNACLDDAQVQAQTNSVLAANKLPVNLSHIYVMYLPKHFEARFFPGPTSNAKNACTINY